MFTGIVMARGSVLEVIPAGGDLRLRIGTGNLDLGSCSAGDSISVSGVCLTMLQPQYHEFMADVSAETRQLTTLGTLRAGSPVNLDGRPGGHLVSGHVDGLGRLISRRDDGRSQRYEFDVPPPLMPYIAHKGSITIDGVSLTVNSVHGAQFSVCLIPHTLEVTSLGNLQPGQQVNIEVDLVARYLERLLIAGVESTAMAAAANENGSES